MRFLSWNVNGLRACLKHGFQGFLDGCGADFVALQETKMEPGQAEIDLGGYTAYWNAAQRKGYSGTAIFARHAPRDVCYGIGCEEHDAEGRVITLQYEDFALVNCYTPNAQRELARLGYRMRWEDAFQAYLRELDAHTPVILCGDLNVAHTEKDIKNARSNQRNAGFTIEERTRMTELLSSGFADTYRRLHPDVTDGYTWWSYMGNARAKNTGWRIDYFIVSERLMPRVADAAIHPDVMGSDHCPVALTLDA